MKCGNQKLNYSWKREKQAPGYWQVLLSLVLGSFSLSCLLAM